jgi:hypothetical protein
MATKRQAVIAAFGNLPQLDAEYVDFSTPAGIWQRRLIRTGRASPRRATSASISHWKPRSTRRVTKIRERDGTKICDEVIEGLIGWLELHKSKT